MDASGLPLLELFNKLRDVGLPLGINEYQLVLKSLQGGFGIKDKAALKRLCQTLWVKSHEEKQIFEYYFQKLVVDKVTQIDTPEKSGNTFQQLQSFTTVRNLILATFVVGTIFIITASHKQSQQLQNPQPTPTPTLIPNQEAQQQPNQIYQNLIRQNLFLLSLLFIITLTSSYFLFRWLISRLRKKEITYIKEKSQLDYAGKSWFSEKNIRQGVEKLNIDIPFQPAKKINNSMSTHDFLLTRDYLPITQRQMKQIWRYFRCMVREGTPTELDITATVNDIGRKGLLLKPILIPRRVNKSELLLLIDRDGSMVPFGAISHQLIETAMGGRGLSNCSTYYFHNCPTEYLYHDPNHQEAELISNILNHNCSSKTAILI